MTETLPVHSPLGASSAERWMNCPGSVTLLQHLGLDESEEPDYRREGIAMHEAAAHCLREGLDAWEIVNQTFYETLMTPELADPIQVYLDHCRSKPLAAPRPKGSPGLALLPGNRASAHSPAPRVRRKLPPARSTKTLCRIQTGCLGKMGLAMQSEIT